MTEALEGKYVVREAKIKTNRNGEYVDSRVIQIGYLDDETGIIYPSPLSNFIKAYYRSNGNSLSTQNNPAREIVKFLNYVFSKVKSYDSDFADLKSQGVFGLNLTHGSRFLTYLTREGRDSTYVESIERYLTDFYVFLEQEKIINPFEKNQKYNRRTKSYYYESPFRHVSLGTEFPDKTEDDNEDLDVDYGILKDFGKKRVQILAEFIATARVVHPEIALGVCFQFLGGVRRSEAINLAINSLDTSGGGSDKFVLKIKDNQRTLFSHLKNTTQEQVKRPRTQTLLLCDLLSDVYKEHILMLQKMKSQFLEKQARKPEFMRRVWNNSGLFMSARNGQPISGENYSDKFEEIKKAYLENLLEKKRFEDYERLNTRWATHIGRGVFTNFLVSLGLSPSQVAIARGDKNLMSALAYFEERNLIENMDRALREVEEAYKNKESGIEITHVKRWKEVFRLASRI